MSKEINLRYPVTGLASGTLYFTIRANPDQMWNTSGTPNFETITVANWASYAITMAEDVSGCYLYVGTFPAISGNMVAGWYWVEIYLEASPGTAAISDTLVCQLYGYWTGTVFQVGAGDVETWKNGSQVGTTVPLPASGSMPETANTSAKLDATVGSRMATFSYTAPDNADIGTILTAIQNGTYGLSALQTLLAAAATATGQTSILNAINALTRNTARSMPVTGTWWVRPATGTTSFSIDLYLYNLAGQLEDPDSNAVTISAGSTAGGTQYNGNLAATAMTRVAAGHYRVAYSVAGLDQSSPHAQGEVYLSFAWTITETVNGSSTAVAGADAAVIEVQDAEQLATLNAINKAVGGGNNIAAGAAGGLPLLNGSLVVSANTTYWAGHATTVDGNNLPNMNATDIGGTAQSSGVNLLTAFSAICQVLGAVWTPAFYGDAKMGTTPLVQQWYFDSFLNGHISWVGAIGGSFYWDGTSAYGPAAVGSWKIIDGAGNGYEYQGDGDELPLGNGQDWAPFGTTSGTITDFEWQPYPACDPNNGDDPGKAAIAAAGILTQTYATSIGVKVTNLPADYQQHAA